MKTSIKATGLRLTADDRRQIEAMLTTALRPLGSDATPAVHAAVEVGLAPGGGHRAEVTLALGGATLRAEATADTLRQVLVDVRHILTRQVRDWRERRRDAQRQPKRNPPIDPQDAALDLDAEPDRDGFSGVDAA